MAKQQVVFRDDVHVELIQAAASDAQVARAARVSTQGGNANDEDYAGLIRFLMNNRHGSPFEHNMFTYYIEAPIFVVRELVRHRIASYNETSGRYRQLDMEFYLPNKDRKLNQVGKTGEYKFEDGTKAQHKVLRDMHEAVYYEAADAYGIMLECGIAREVARNVLPVGTYTSLYMTVNARSLMNFLSLRVEDPASTFPSYPQHEIAQLAEKMEVAFKELMPATWRAFIDNGRVAP